MNLAAPRIHEILVNPIFIFLLFFLSVWGMGFHGAQKNLDQAPLRNFILGVVHVYINAKNRTSIFKL